MAGTQPLRAKRDSEGPGQLSPTEAWNRVHLLLHPALTLSGPEALGSGWHLHRGVAGPPIRTVPDHSSSTSGPKVNPASPLPCVPLFLVGSTWRWICPLQRGPPTPSHLPLNTMPCTSPQGTANPKLRRRSSQRLGSHLQTLPDTASRQELHPQTASSHAPGLQCTQL